MLNLLSVLSLEDLTKVCDAFRARQQLLHETESAECDDTPPSPLSPATLRSPVNSEIDSKAFVMLLLPFVVDALVRLGFEAPIDDDGDDVADALISPSSPPKPFASVISPSISVSSSAPTYLQHHQQHFGQKSHQKIAKIAQRELRDLFRSIDVKQKGQIDWSDLLRYFVDEIDRRSVGANQGGLSGERIAKLSNVGETLSFEQASAGSHSIYTVAHVTPTPDRRNANVSLFVPEWGGYIFGISEAGKQGFELVDASTLQLVRVGFHCSQSNSYQDKLSTILQAVAVPKHSLIVACHHDSTVSFWSLPGTGPASYAPGRDAATTLPSGDSSSAPTSLSSFYDIQQQTVRTMMNLRAKNSNASLLSAQNLRNNIVCFKKMHPNETPEHVRLFEWHAESATLFSGSSNGIIRKWVLTSSSSAVERHAPNPKEFVQAHAMNVTQILSAGPNRIVTTSMDRTICVIDTATMTVVDKRGGRSIAGLRGQNHSQGIVGACVLEYDRNEILVATAGFDEDILLWSLFPGGFANGVAFAAASTKADKQPQDGGSSSNSAFVMSMMKPTRLTDPSNPHRGAIYSLSKLSSSSTSVTSAGSLSKNNDNKNNDSCSSSSHLLVSGDAVGIVKIWDTRILRCVQTVQTCRLGDDEPPPPVIISNSAISALVLARKSQTEIVDAEHVMSAQTRRVFKGTSAPSGQLRHFVYSVDPKTMALLATGPRSSVLLRGHVPRNPDRCDDFSVLGAVQIPEIGCVLTLHNDCTKMWQLATGALTSVHAIFRTNLTSITLDKQSRCYFVGDAKGVVSVHSIYTGMEASRWKVFATGDPILALRSMRRRDGVHLLFAISDVGGVSVTQSDDDFYDRQLVKCGADSNGGKPSDQSAADSSKKRKKTLELPQEQRKVQNLNAVITRNIGVLQRYLDSATHLQEGDRSVIPVSHDGRVDQYVSECAAKLVRTGSTLTNINRTRRSGSSRRALRQRRSRGGGEGEGGNVVTSRSASRLHRTGSSFFVDDRHPKKQQGDDDEMKCCPPSRSCIKGRATAEGNNNGIATGNRHFEDEVDFLTVIAYHETSLVCFVAGSVVLVLDTQSLEIVHAFHVGCRRTVVAACDMGPYGAICVVDSECVLTVFGVRPSHVANQILCIRDLSRAHPSKWWVRTVKEGEVEAEQTSKHEKVNKVKSATSFRHALPTCITFHRHTCSIVVGDEHGGLSSWSLRGLKASLLLRPMRYPLASTASSSSSVSSCSSPPSNVTSSIKRRAKQLRQVENIVVPADVFAFGVEVVAFEFRRGCGKSLEKIVAEHSKMKRKQNDGSDENRSSRTKKATKNDKTCSNSTNDLPFITVPTLLEDDDEEFESESFPLPAVATSLHTMKTSLKLPFATARSIRDGAWPGMFSSEDDACANSTNNNSSNNNYNNNNNNNSDQQREQEQKQNDVDPHEDDDLFSPTDDAAFARKLFSSSTFVNPSSLFDKIHPSANTNNMIVNQQQRHNQNHDVPNKIASEIGVRDVLALQQTGNRVAFLSIGGSDCRVVLLNRELGIFGELQQSRTRDKLAGHEIVSTEEEVLFRLAAKKKGGDEEVAAKSCLANGIEDKTSPSRDNIKNASQDRNRVVSDEVNQSVLATSSTTSNLNASIIDKSRLQVRNKDQLEASVRRDRKRFAERRREEAAAGTIPWRYFELKEEGASFIDPRVDLTDDIVRHLLRYIRDVRLRLAHRKKRSLLLLFAGTEGTSENTTRNDECSVLPSSSVAGFSVARKLGRHLCRSSLLHEASSLEESSTRTLPPHQPPQTNRSCSSSKGANDSSDGSPTRSTTKIPGGTTTTNSIASSSPSRVKSFVGRKSPHGHHHRVLSFLTDEVNLNINIHNNNNDSSHGESRNNNNNATNNNDNNNGLSVHDAFGRHFKSAERNSANDNDDASDGDFPVQTYSPVPKHKTALNKFSNNQLPQQQASPPSSQLPRQVHHLLYNSTTASPTATTSSLSPEKHGNPQHFVSQYHNTISPPTSLQRRRFQLNPNCAVTLPALELDFKEVLKEAEEVWKTGKSTETTTISACAPCPEPQRHRRLCYQQQVQDQQAPRGGSKNDPCLNLDNSTQQQHHSAGAQSVTPSSPSLLTARNKKDCFFPPSLPPAPSPSTSSTSASFPSTFMNDIKNSNSEVSTRRDTSSRKRVFVGQGGISPSLGLTGEEIVRIRETVKSSRELLSSFPRMRLAPPAEDLRLPQTSRPLNLPPMKL